MTNIHKGFYIDSPSIFVPWHITTDDLLKLSASHKINLHKVTNGYYTLKNCKALGGMVLNIGFHFEPRENGVLSLLEFFLDDYSNLEFTYKTFQNHLESVFGEPQNTETGTFDVTMPSHIWRIRQVTINHFVFDRFGPEERVSIKNEYRKNLWNLWGLCHIIA